MPKISYLSYANYVNAHCILLDSREMIQYTPWYPLIILIILLRNAKIQYNIVNYDYDDSSEGTILNSTKIHETIDTYDNKQHEKKLEASNNARVRWTTRCKLYY